MAAWKVSTGMRTRLKPLVSWLAATLGCLIGFGACAAFGMAWAPLSDRSPAWYLRFFDIAGMALLGLGFLLGSFVALRHRRSAGTIFLAVMPVAAFCLAYPASGFLVWRDGGGWFETPVPVIAIGLTAIFYAPFLAALWMWRRKKRAAIVFTSTALVAGLIFAYSRWTVALLPRLMGWSAPFLLWGLFWLRTGKLGWPSLVQPRPCSPAKRILAVVTACVGILCLDVVFTLLGSSLFSGDCRGKPPFLHPLSPTHAVFTARVLFAGRSIGAMMRPSSIFRGDPAHTIHDRKAGDWALGIVNERFWGMPHWTRLVLLTNDIYWEDETYFVDGSRYRGLLTRLLPIVEGGINCSRTRPVQNAIVDLRLLRQPPPASGTRITGYVRGPEVFTSGLARPTKPAFLAGAQINVTGPACNRTVSTDSAGVYELDDLMPGDYTLQLSTPDTQAVGFFNSDGSPAAIHLDSGGVVERNFELFWNGRIEGEVKDNAGKPAHAWVELISADGSQIPGYVNFFEMTVKDGSYQFRKIPPGRYMVMVNPNGPYGEWPYDLQYYPSEVRQDKARVFELAAGQRMVEIDFRLPLLPERSTQVRVTWANGTAAAGAHVCVAYEGADDYESLIGRSCVSDADQNGMAVIHTYGRSQVRIFAYHIVDRANQQWPDHLHSRPVQSAADQTQNRINLVLIPAKR